MNAMGISVRLGVCALAMAALAVTSAAEGSGAVENSAYRLSVRVEKGVPMAALDDLRLNLRIADGPIVYRVGEYSKNLTQLADARVEAGAGRLIVRGKLAGLDVEHTFLLPTDRPVMDERLVLANGGKSTVSIREIEVGFVKTVADAGGELLPETARDRWVAVPLRRRASSPEHVYDYSMDDMVNKSFDPRPREFIKASPMPSDCRWSEGWAWRHGRRALGVFKFSQEHMLFSVVSAHKTPSGVWLRFGGTRTVMGEPSALAHIAPGESVDLGLTRYQTFDSGYTGALYGFRKMLDEMGCRFPSSYDPPTHWEQLYDMEGAWDDRPINYTRAALESEAAKGVEYSCEALYLDPGWDTAFGTFLWGDWLGSRADFMREMEARYGLAVSLHCPLATWMSSSGPMGPSGISSWPASAERKNDPDAVRDDIRSVAVRDGRRNLALLPMASANASSVIPGYAIHTVAHLNDGRFGNSQSWIANEASAWAEIDLGADHKVSGVVLSSDSTGSFGDRRPTRLRIMVATEYGADSSGPGWKTVATYEGPGIGAAHGFDFAPVTTRWVRVAIEGSADGNPRLDEMIVLEAGRASEAEIRSLCDSVAARLSKEPPLGVFTCLGSKQYLDEAARRLLDNCADGAAFLMFDGNYWNEGCSARDHGHPVPYTYEDHMRANLSLAQRVHERYPNVYIEMHDMLTGGSSYRLTPVYYKYGLPGSYDDNWGFELMWDCLRDIKSGRARALYYYNMGCNVPAYLHVDLRKDNENAIVLWWFASTCRHLGIGGTHSDPKVIAIHKREMKRYKEWERFYKRGEFYGLSEEIHVHTLPGENAFVVNLFNLSDKPRVITGSADVSGMGLDPSLEYRGSSEWGQVDRGRLSVKLKMAPWSAAVAEFSGARL